MPAFYKIDKERKLVLSTGSGLVTKEEVFAHQDQMLNDPDFDPSFSQLADFRRLTNTDINMADLRTIAQKDVFSVHSRRAIIAKGDIAFGFAKIFELYRRLAGAHGIRVFRTKYEALDWLFNAGTGATFRVTASGGTCSPPESGAGSA
jgi:hypothetical protein